MLSTTKIAAVLAVAALGISALLLSTPTDRGDRPAAEAALPGASAASTFSGTRLNDPDERVPPESSTVDGVTSNRGDIQRGMTIQATDERFSGEMDFAFESDIYGGQATGVFWGDQRVSNEGGSWTGPLIGAGNPMGHWRASGHFVGDGDYEGLVAIVYFDSDLTFEGAIVPGELPPRE